MLVISTCVYSVRRTAVEQMAAFRAEQIVLGSEPTQLEIVRHPLPRRKSRDLVPLMILAMNEKYGRRNGMKVGCQTSQGFWDSSYAAPEFAATSTEPVRTVLSESRTVRQ